MFFIVLMIFFVIIQNIIFVSDYFFFLPIRLPAPFFYFLFMHLNFHRNLRISIMIYEPFASLDVCEMENIF